MKGLFCFLALASSTFADITLLATFDGANETTWDWFETNDPVMGGKSFGTFSVDQENKIGVFNGTCAIVPSLRAPGFCNAQTKMSLLKHFPDVSKYIDNGQFVIKVRSSTPDFKGFKLAWGAKGVPKGSIYGNPSFKAPFLLHSTQDWQVVSVDMSSFSWDWSPYTGSCDTKDPTGTQHYCCTDKTPNYCPTSKFLSAITNVELWAEGSEGDFHLEVAWIGVGQTGPDAVCNSNEYCCPEAKACLAPTGKACPNSGDKCGQGEICCPLTKLCVKPGKPCVTPCASTEYCCPEVKMCLTPVKPGNLCKVNSDCGAGGVCCPVTKLCVSVGNKCTPP